MSFGEITSYSLAFKLRNYLGHIILVKIDATMRFVMLKGRGTWVEHFTGLWMEQASEPNCPEEKPECISTWKGKFHRERSCAFAPFCCREVFSGNWEAAGRPIGWCFGRALELPKQSWLWVHMVTCQNGLMAVPKLKQDWKAVYKKVNDFIYSNCIQFDW